MPCHAVPWINQYLDGRQPSNYHAGTQIIGGPLPVTHLVICGVGAVLLHVIGSIYEGELQLGCRSLSDCL